MPDEPNPRDLLRPHSPAVYRRRRLAALVVLLLALLILVGLVWWVASLFRPGGDEQAGQPVTSPTVSVSASATHPTHDPAAATASTEPSEGLTAEPSTSGTPATSATGSASPSDSASPSASGAEPAESESAEGAPVDAAPCQPGDLAVSAATDQDSYPEGQEPVLELRVDNTGSEPCAANLGTSQQVFTVYSGSDRVFSTQDCQVGGEDAMMEIAPDEQEISRFPWPRVRSAPGCQTADSPLDAGAYRLEVSLGELRAQPVSFTLQ